MSEDLPKQELLIKLLKMTTSSNDGEAVVAIRKANALLTSAGWDWDKLIHGKIKVIEDPFKNVANPFNSTRQAPPPPPPPRPQPAHQAWNPPPRPHPQPAPKPAAPPPPPPPPQPISTKANMYAKWCYCCGDPVQAQDGFIFDPATKNRGAMSKWQVICKACNVNPHAYVGRTAAPRQRPLSNVPPLSAI